MLLADSIVYGSLRKISGNFQSFKNMFYHQPISVCSKLQAKVGANFAFPVTVYSSSSSIKASNFGTRWLRFLESMQSVIVIFTNLGACTTSSIAYFRLPWRPREPKSYAKRCANMNTIDEKYQFLGLFRLWGCLIMTQMESWDFQCSTGSSCRCHYSIAIVLITTTWWSETEISRTSFPHTFPLRPKNWLNFTPHKITRHVCFELKLFTFTYLILCLSLFHSILAKLFFLLPTSGSEVSHSIHRNNCLNLHPGLVCLTC